MFTFIGAPATYLVIVAGFALLYFLIPRKYTLITFIALTAALSVYAFHIEPNHSDDVMRYYMQLDYLREFGNDYLQRCFNEGINNWDTYRVCGYYFYALSHLDNNQYMPAITIAITYGLMFWCLYKAANRYNIEKLNLFFGAMVILSTYWFYDTWAGIRNGLCYAVIFACAYYHLVEGKNLILCLGGYIAACLFHSAGFILVVMVLTAWILQIAQSKYLTVAAMFGITLGGVLIRFLSSRIDSPFFNDISEKAEGVASASSVFDTNFIVNIVFTLVFMIVLWYGEKFVKRRTNEDKGLARFNEFYIVTLLFIIGCVFSSLILKRIARWVLPPVAAIFYMVSLQFQQDDLNKGLDEKEINGTYEVVPIRTRTKALYRIIIFVFLCVHLWYLYSGSSLAWANFFGE